LRSLPAVTFTTRSATPPNFKPEALVFAVLRLPRVNLFLADDTGLGKTIEAGLIARELLLRKKAKTLVVAAPPSVLEQWKSELEERFGLTFEILDRVYLVLPRDRGLVESCGCDLTSGPCDLALPRWDLAS
jgi:SNF2 family DNA or RNA helicase